VAASVLPPSFVPPLDEVPPLDDVLPLDDVAPDDEVAPESASPVGAAASSPPHACTRQKPVTTLSEASPKTVVRMG
jgi:hypothetical protein